MLYTSEERSSDSSLVQAIWRSQSQQSGSFMSSASVYWEMVLMKYKGKMSITVRGPETKASPADYPAEAEWMGITFKLGTFMPDLPPGQLLDRNDVNLPEASGKSFWLNGSSWEFPTYDNADTFVDRLVRIGILVRDPLVDDIMQDCLLDLSPRAVQYRFQKATGLTRQAAQKILRARRASSLLEQGCPIFDTAYQLGYFDQSHLTNSLKRYMGHTPAQGSQVLQPQ